MDWFEIPLLGVAETIIKLGTKSRFGDRGMAEVALFWACLFFILLLQLKFQQLSKYSDSNDRQYIQFVIVLVFTVAVPTQGVPRKENKTGKIFHSSANTDL